MWRPCQYPCRCLVNFAHRPDTEVLLRDQIFFGYIHGLAPRGEELSDARLSLSAEVEKVDGTHVDVGTLDRSFSEWPQHRIIVRQRGQYGGPLKPGLMEIIADFELPSRFTEKGNWTFKADARLSDGRTLFCIDATIWLEGDVD